MGDGIMALFGAPVAHEDHAVRGCYAALRMQESVKRYAEGVRRIEGIPIHIRVGLNSGEVVVRSIESDLKMDYTAVGQTTHLAARMEQMAMPGSILIAADTLSLTEGFVQLKRLGPVNVKGLNEPVEVYEVTGAIPVRSRLQAAAARGLTRFVGRDAELDTLRRALDKAGNARGQVVALVGEPGVGKSRLFWEFTHSRRTVDWLILESGSVSYGKATPYLPLIDLLKAYFKISGRDDHREVREKVTGKLLTLDKALEPTLPAFLTLLDVAVEDAQWQNLDPPQRRQRTLEAIKRLLLRESQIQPLILVIEDLHWIDSETQAFLDTLIEALPTTRLLLLVNYRPEYQHGWGGKTYYSQLRVDPLLPENAGELLDALLGADANMQLLKQLLIERTEGNPFFLEESVRTLVETKVLIGAQGYYSLTKPIEETQIPATVQAVLAARIDRLPPEEKRLLQSAAVIGKDVPFVLLQAIEDQSDEELRKALTALQAAEFLYETSLFPDLEYTFKHALTHEVAYGSFLQERRGALHARIVEAIEKLYSDRLTEQVERLAHHALRGELWGKAVEYSHQAGVKSTTRSANREAIPYFEQALEVLGHLPENHQTIEKAINIRVDLGPVLTAQRGFAAPDVEENYTRALSLCERLGDDPPQLFPVLWGLWQFSIYVGHLETARQRAQQLFTVAQHAQDPALVLEAHHTLWSTLIFQGDLEAAWFHLDHGLKLYNPQQHHSLTFRYGGHDPGVCCQDKAARALWLLGYPDQSLKKCQDAVNLARELGHPYSLALAHHRTAWVQYACGDGRRARGQVEASITLSTEQRFPSWIVQGAIMQGRFRVDEGQAEEGIEQLSTNLVFYRNAGVALEQPYYLALLAEAFGKVGRIDEGLAELTEALARAHQTGECYYEAELLRIKGELLLSQTTPGVEEAERCFREAIEVARRRKSKSLELRAAMSLSRLWQQQGKKDDARKLLGDIYGWFTEGFETVDLKAAKALLNELT